MVFIYFLHTSTRTFSRKNYSVTFLLQKTQNSLHLLPKSINIPLLTYFFVIKRKQLLKAALFSFVIELSFSKHLA